MPTPSKRITAIVPSGKDGWEVHSAAWARQQAGEDIIMLSVGDHDFDTPSETIEACVNAVRGSNHHYTPLPGLPRLRKAMAAASTACTGIETEPGEIIATQGGQAALYAAVQTVLDPGDHAIVVAPYYATYPNTFSAAGATFTVVETPAEDGFQPRADYWTLGGGEHISPRSMPGMAERTLVINSMSKSHGMTGWRMGWLTGPTEMIRLLTDLNLVTTYGLPAFI
ncbi:MAG: aminotransferase class I/II-fold pyridoxal phosphate-dependent enzyme, partial [Mesorhizobium sp.]